jgi:hypothetical protein
MTLFCVSVFLCVASGLESSRYPVQGVLLTVYKISSFRIDSEWDQAREPNPLKQKKKIYYSINESGP